MLLLMEGQDEPFILPDNVFENRIPDNALTGFINKFVDNVRKEIIAGSGLLQSAWINKGLGFNTSVDNLEPSIAVDSNGNVLLAFYTEGNVSVIDNPNIYGGYEGLYDIVVCKLNGVTGETMWVRQGFDFNTTAHDEFPSIAVDSLDNVIVAFSTDGDVSDAIYENSNLIYGGNSGNSDIVVCKLDGEKGETIWVRQSSEFNTSGNDTEPSIAVDSSDNVIVAFLTNGTVIGGVKTGDTDVVVCKLNGGTGLAEWVKQTSDFNTTGNTSSPSIAVDSSDNVIVAYVSFVNKDDIVVFKLEDDGTFSWVKRSVNLSITVDNIDGISIATDNDNDNNNDNNIVIALSTRVNDFANIAVLKLDGNGNEVWLKQGTDINTEGDNTNPSIAVKNNNNIVVAYSGDGSVADDINEYQSIIYGSGKGEFDIVVFELQGDDGTTQWVSQNHDINTTNVEEKPSIALDSDDNIIIAFNSDNYDTELNSIEVVKYNAVGQS